MPGQADALEVCTHIAPTEDQAIDDMDPTTDGSCWEVTDEVDISQEYTIRVIETRTYEMEVKVRADSLEEANELAENGETEIEVEIPGFEVINREIEIL